MAQVPNIFGRIIRADDRWLSIPSLKKVCDLQINSKFTLKIICVLWPPAFYNQINWNQRVAMNSEGRLRGV